VGELRQKTKDKNQKTKHKTQNTETITRSKKLETDITMRDFSIYSVSILNILITIRYCWLLYKGKTKPALAMWLFFTIAVGMSLITYMANGGYSFMDNILNTTDIIYVGTVTIAIIFWGDKTSKFTKFDMGCLVAVLLIVLFWIITQNHVVTNFCIQGILVTVYTVRAIICVSLLMILMLRIEIISKQKTVEQDVEQ